MEGMRQHHVAKWLALTGLLVMACGGLFYAVSISRGEWGLIGAGAGLALVLLAALAARESVAAFFRKRSARLGMGSGVAILAALALVMFLGALGSRHHVRWDFSQGTVHTLSPQTVKILKNLKEPVKAYAFFKDTQAGRVQAEQELAKYSYASRLFTYRFVSPDQEPGLAKAMKVRNYGTVVLVSGGREERVQLPEEQALTNALIRLGKKDKKRVYFLTGHGEPSLDGVGKEDFTSLRKAIEASNYEVKSLMLITSSQVPPDAAVVVMAGPQKALMPQEIERLSAYWDQGGSLLMLLDPGSDGGLKKWLGQKGVDLGNDLVIDQASRLANLSPLAPLASQYGFHDITKMMSGTFCFFPQARSVSLAAKLPEGVKGEVLVKTSPDSWATDYGSFLSWYKAQMDKLKQGKGEGQRVELEPKEGDRKGPIGLGVALDKEGKTPAGQAGDRAPNTSRLVVIGDADFANNEFLDLAGNHDLVMNSVSWLAADEDLVAIRAKKRTSQPLLLQPVQERLLFWIPLVVWPVILAVVGAAVIFRRRRGR